MLSPYGQTQVVLIVLVSLLAAVGCIVLQWWVALGIVALAFFAALSFFRDPDRQIPPLRGAAVAPADGKISSIHEVEHFEAFDGPAVCVRIFLSVLDVHVNRSPLHGRVVSRTHRPGQYLNALKAESAELNESVTLVLNHPTRATPLAAVRQVAGAIARTIVCSAREGDILHRGQRYGMIKFGSTTELYLPQPDRVKVQVRQGQRVWGGATILALLDGESSAAATTSSEEPEMEVGEEG
ncbi:MAG: phosphatidylserine decarboxylase [Phycisphaerae bacterium]|nr:phosphatidylserine decarboxylase [Phycisphaerae bacterium]